MSLIEQDTKAGRIGPICTVKNTLHCQLLYHGWAER